MTCGLYTIVNALSGKVYAGSARNIERRWKRHRTNLRTNKYHNLHLQRAVNKYGLDKFNFEIHTVLDPEKDDLLVEEQKLLDELFDTGQPYNISKDARAGFTGKNHSVKSKKQISENNGRYWSGKERSDETKSKIKVNHARYWKGKTHSAETRRKISEKMREVWAARSRKC